MVHNDDPKAHNSWKSRQVVAPVELDVDLRPGGLGLTIPELALVTIEPGVETWGRRA